MCAYGNNTVASFLRSSFDLQKASLILLSIKLLLKPRNSFPFAFRVMAQTDVPNFPVFQYSDFDADALCQIANRVRQGPRCLCNLNQRPARGGFNWAILLQFEDGVEWVFRSPVQNHSELSSDYASKLLLSEAATLKFLRDYLEIPVPHVYWKCPNRDNPVRVPYILMSKAPGKTLETMWGTEDFHDRLDTLAIYINKVMFQLGYIARKLAGFRFAEIGSLVEENGYFVIGECLSRGHLQHKRCSLKTISRGPFKTDHAFYRSLMATLARHAEVLPLGPHCFSAPVPARRDYSTAEEWKDACSQWGDFVTVGQKIDTAANRIDYIIASDALNDMIARYGRNWQGITSSPLYALCHPNLSVNNIFVDDQYNITCIIDWAFTTTVPLPWLLSPPGLPQSRNRLDDRFYPAFRNGFRDGLRDALRLGVTGQPESFCLSRAIRCIENNQFAWCLSRFLSLDSTEDLTLFRTLWEEVYPPEKKLESYFFSRRTSPRFRAQYARIVLEDLSPRQIQQTENESFKSLQFELSMARHLTMISDWGFHYDPFKCAGLRDTEQIFTTEPRLWRWILKFKEEHRNRVSEERECTTGDNRTGTEGDRVAREERRN